MGYAVYEDQPARALGVERWAGYGVPAVCDVAGCKTRIDRGMDYRCETYIVYIDVDTDGNPCAEDDPNWADEVDEEHEGCQLHFCAQHGDHSVHGDDVTPKPDTSEWIAFMLSDESWADWRTENSEKTKQMRAALAAEKGQTHDEDD